MPTSLLHRQVDARQLLIVLAYQATIWGMYWLPELRHALLWLAAMGMSFMCCIVAHNHLHKGIFRSERLNTAFRYLLSFCALYPISTNVPAHNLVHHRFEDDGGPDWADQKLVTFRWNLLNLLHFPNVAGTVGLEGTKRWMSIEGRAAVRRQWQREQIFCLGVTALALGADFWAGLFFIVLPQLWGARGILRLNLLQHEACDLGSRYNHSRNFTGALLNWLICNNGYHTIHHNRAGIHWSELPAQHERLVVPRCDPSLNEPSMLWYLLRTYVLQSQRAEPKATLAHAER